ncbi:DegT/DnrJ/EryC1/StrS family aminotransferase [Actinoplanes sp. NPDC023936]|uniref:DegT/DnrJ/EryC1/StrS family aminotransferase n=1 Tax=Actinoplanes sp. NPDC023936 TaxID=3154910 RepID=UPI0033C4118D
MLALHGGSPVVTESMIGAWPQVTDADRQAVLAAMDESTPWHWPMRVVQQLERDWAGYTGARHALAANSGTAALHMCIAACDIGPGDEVLVPADTFLASASCVLQVNAVPVFVDVDPVTYNIDPAQVEARITERTRAIVAVDLNGLPADYDALHAIARKHGLVVIEDGSQAHGATYHGRQVGALGDLAGCSLNGSKTLSALSEGGLFTTDNDEWRENAARVLMFGDEIKGKKREYNARMMGWNYRIHSLAAAFAGSQLSRLAEMTRIRQENGAYLSEALAGVPGIRTPVVPDDRTHVYFFYPMMVDAAAMGFPEHSDETVRRALKVALRAEGVPVDEWQPQPIPGQTLFQERRGYGKGCPWTCGPSPSRVQYHSSDYPVAEDICRRRLVLGGSVAGFGPPNGRDLMQRFGEAFRKVVVEHRSELAVLVKEEAG